MTSRKEESNNLSVGRGIAHHARRGGACMKYSKM